MSKMVSLFTYFIVFIITSWGLYYILQFYGYEQALIFLNVYMIYYLFLFATVFFAIIFNTYTGIDMNDSGCPKTASQENIKMNILTTQISTPTPLPNTPTTNVTPTPLPNTPTTNVTPTKI